MPFGGQELVYPPGFGDGLSLDEFEPGFVNYLRDHLAMSMVFLDVGAYFGSYVCIASPCVKEVIAVEPHPDIRNVLLETITRNDFENVTVFSSPLFSRVVKGQLGRRNNFQVTPDGTMETVILDSMGISPDVIKIDVEGAEYDVLVGGQQTIERCKPAILVEIHIKKIERFSHTAKQVRHLLIEWGYELTDVGSRKESQFVIAEA